MTVYFIGAGIGGVEYLTVKARDILTQAQVVIYDALVEDSILNLVPQDCQQIYGGKRGGKVSTSQAQINQLLVQYGKKYDRVIRLKSGDIGIFGRVNEELNYLQAHHLDYELIPGVSSALAVPLLAQIMLTEKQYSRCVSIITGHNPNSCDWSILSQIDTLVILMGGRNLPVIVEQLLAHNRPLDFPITVIKNGGRLEQQIWKGTLGNILSMTIEISLSPCIIVIGKVAAI